MKAEAWAAAHASTHLHPPDRTAQQVYQPPSSALRAPERPERVRTGPHRWSGRVRSGPTVRTSRARRRGLGTLAPTTARRIPPRWLDGAQDDGAERRERDRHRRRRVPGTARNGRDRPRGGVDRGRPGRVPRALRDARGRGRLPHRPGTSSHAAVRNAVVAFEVDDIDPVDHEGWSRPWSWAPPTRSPRTPRRARIEELALAAPGGRTRANTSWRSVLNSSRVAASPSRRSSPRDAPRARPRRP